MAEHGYTNSVYAAVYSGIQVYEMICRGIAVMRRHSDSWLNATQLLKVAGVEKGRRTKILEREVLTGTHEKIQGGYGKYQGTWVPFARGTQLCKQYGVFEYVRPILEHDPTASGTRPDKTPTKAEVRRLMKSAQKSVGVKREQGAQGAGGKRFKINSSAATSPINSDVTGFQPNGHVPSTPAFMREERVSSVPRMSATPFHQTLYSSPATGFGDSLAPPRMDWHTQNSQHNHADDPSSQTLAEPDSDAQTKGDRIRLMNIFLNEDSGYIPDWLAVDDIKSHINVDLVIDDQGHTAVHWAAALARIHVLDLLLLHGADPRRLNYEGESSLVRAVQVTNNFENQTFPDLLELLHDTIPLTDKHNRTVLHHISMAAGTEGREKAARYYADCLLSWIVRLAGGYQVDADTDKAEDKMLPTPTQSSSPRGHRTVFSSLGQGTKSGITDDTPPNADFAAFLNLQDMRGDTALNIAARVGDRAMVRMLLNAGASPSICNRMGLSPLDFGVATIAETDSLDDTHTEPDSHTNDAITSPTPSSRVRTLIQTPLRSTSGANKNLLASLMSTQESPQTDVWSPASAEQRMHDSVLSIQRLMSDLESEFTGELKSKHVHFDSIKQQLRNTTIELARARDTIHKLHTKTSQLDEIKSRVEYLEDTLVRETDAVREAISDLPSESKARNDLQNMLDTLLAQPDCEPSDLPLVPSAVDEDNMSELEHDPVKLRAAVERLRLVNQVYARRDALLRERVLVLRKRADVSERERQYRQIIATCCEIPEEGIDIWIDKFVSAVESQDIQSTDDIQPNGHIQTNGDAHTDSSDYTSYTDPATNSLAAHPPSLPI
ncbi:transcriptional regulator swi6 [Coemansia sp. RSA 521]|nr:transcriptional regulator swi6 [Coemansia sp. RSA 521]